MDANFSPDFGRFQDRHGLHNQGILNAEFLAELPDPWSVRDILEDLVVLMESMAYLVDRLPFGYDHLVVFPSFGFEEEADLVRRVDEIFAEAM